MKRFLLVAVTTFFLVVWSAAQTSQWFDNYDPAFSDIKNDWIVAEALIHGDNPYRDLHELSTQYASESYEPPGEPGTAAEPIRTPRTPGAIVLAIPWTLLPLSEVTQWNNLLTLLLIVPTVGVLIWNRADPIWLMASLAIAFSGPTLWNLKFSDVSMVVSALMTWYLVTGERRDSSWSGIALALATTLKLFPGILLVHAALAGRRRTAIWGIAVLVVLNLLPLALPAVKPEEAISAIAGATANFASSDFNVSFGHRLGSGLGMPVLAGITAATLGALLVWIAKSPRTFAVDSLLLVGSAVLLVRISWPHYALLVLPFAILLVAHQDTTVAARALIVGGALFMVPSTNPWLIQVGVLVFVLATILDRILNPSSPPPRPLSVPVSTH